MEKFRSHVVLTHEEWDKFRALLRQYGITHEPSGYGNNVYVSMEVTQQEYELVDKLLEQI